MSINIPTHDFVTSSLVDAIDNSQDTMIIGAGLNIPATNGALQIDYDSSIAVGTASGPETILYATYTTATGAVAGITRGSGGTTAVAHDALASVQCGNSSVYYSALSALYNGWITAEETWTRIGDNAFTISGDFTSVYAVGDKLKVTDTTTKYFYITAVSYSTPDTTVTITGGSDYVLAASPTARYYSKSTSPVGFPQWFNWTTTYSGFSVNPTSTNKFSMNGRSVTCNIYPSVSGTSNANTFTLTLPVMPTSELYYSSAILGWDNATTVATAQIDVVPGSLTADMIKNGAADSWTTSGGKYCGGVFIYEAA
jgi:hypothetical protein